jgi:hypothetical protein
MSFKIINNPYLKATLIDDRNGRAALRWMQASSNNL